MYDSPNINTLDVALLWNYLRILIVELLLSKWWTMLQFDSIQFNSIRIKFKTNGQQIALVTGYCQSIHNNPLLRSPFLMHYLKGF